MIQTKESIRANACQAVEDFDKHGKPAINPCQPETDAHREWTRFFYEECLAREMAKQ